MCLRYSVSSFGLWIILLPPFLASFIFSSDKSVWQVPGSVSVGVNGKRARVYYPRVRIFVLGLALPKVEALRHPGHPSPLSDAVVKVDKLLQLIFFSACQLWTARWGRRKRVRLLQWRWVCVVFPSPETIREWIQRFLGRNDSWGRLGGQAYVWSIISYPDLLMTKPICTRDRLSGMWQAMKERMLEINPQFKTC